MSGAGNFDPESVKSLTDASSTRVASRQPVPSAGAGGAPGRDRVLRRRRGLLPGQAGDVVGDRAVPVIAVARGVRLPGAGGIRHRPARPSMRSARGAGARAAARPHRTRAAAGCTGAACGAGVPRRAAASGRPRRPGVAGGPAAAIRARAARGPPRPPAPAVPVAPAAPVVPVPALPVVPAAAIEPAAPVVPADPVVPAPPVDPTLPPLPAPPVVPAAPVVIGPVSLFAQAPIAPSASSGRTWMTNRVDMASPSATFDVSGRRNLRDVLDRPATRPGRPRSSGSR